MISDPETRYAQIALPHPPLRFLTYEVPEPQRGLIRKGHRVLVPLGKRRLTGYVVGFTARPEVAAVKSVAEILDPDPVLSGDLFDLTAWVARYYMASWGEVIRAALPPGLTRNTRWTIRLEKRDWNPASLTPVQNALLGFLKEKTAVPFKTLEKNFPQGGLRLEIGRLEALGLVGTEQALDGTGVNPLHEKWIRLNREPEPEEIDLLAGKAPRQADILRHLLAGGDAVPRHTLDAPFAVLRRMEASGWIAIEEAVCLRDPYAGLELPEPKAVTLTDEQQAALDAVFHPARSGFRPFLLHGVTGSGKTQVYLEAIRRVLDADGSALVLIPEIALTPQAVQRYRAVFGDTVAVLHSRLGAGERFDAWSRIRDGSKRIALGPRSTVFAPLQKLGLIIVDEEHDASYKQMDPAPRYHARDVAVYRARLNRCPVILGSATPSIESYRNTVEGKYGICRLTHRIDHTPLPRVTLVHQADAGQAIFSDLLIERMTQAIRDGQQMILLQNRRGYAVLLRCRACGRIETCPYCAISLTYHRRGNRLKCHYCGFESAVPDGCPACGAAQLKFSGVGTQQVEEALRERFPEIRILRMDLDTTRSKHAHSRIVTEFEKGGADLLLGTQMVAKGHDFPGVGLVGVISADTGLHFPDFRAGERTFQLLTQAAGRAGRRQMQGEVVIQTREPDHPVIRFAVDQAYEDFFDHASGSRKELLYPPFGRLALLRFSGPDAGKTEQAAGKFRSLLPEKRGYDMLGPAPAPLARIRNLYRYHLILRGEKAADPTGEKLRRIIREAQSRYAEPQASAVRVAVDIDPVDML